jgi:hypothetical protein
MKTLQTKSALLASCTAVALLFAGCAQQQTAHKSKPAPGSGSAAGKTGCSEVTTGLIKVAKTMPAEADLGGEFLTELTITAIGCAANVVVRDTVPAGVSYVRSEPAATVDDGVLVWKIGNLDAGQTVKAKVWFKAEKEGQVIGSCATVLADPRVCGVTFIGKPVLAIEMTGPENLLPAVRT